MNLSELMKSRLALFMALPFLFCGCRSGQKAAPPGSTAPPAAHVLAFEERSDDFYEGHPRLLPADAVAPKVDYQSELRIMVKTNELLRQSGAPASVLPMLTPEDQARLDALSKLVSDAREYLRLYDNYTKAYAAKQGRPMGAEEIRDLQRLINEQGEAGFKVMTALKEYATAKARREQPGISGRKLQDRVDQILQPILDGVLNLAAVSQFVADESAAVVREATQNARRVQEAGSVFLRLRAFMIRPAPRVALHISNYDTLSDSDIAQEPRVSFRMSEEDRKRLAAETKVTTEVAALIRDVQSSKSNIRQSFDSLVSALRADLKSWRDAASELDTLKDKLKPVIAALDQAGTVAQLDALQKSVISGALSALRQASNQVNKLRSDVGKIAAINPDTTAETLLAAVTTFSDQLTELATLPQSIMTTVSTNLQKLEQLIANADPQLLPSLKQLTDALAAGAPSSAKAINELLAGTVQKYPNLVASLKALAGKAEVLVAEQALAPIEADPNLIDVAITNLPDGYISLTKNVPRGGVVIEVQPALITRKGGGAPPEVKPFKAQSIGVEKFGLVNTWSANVIFVKRLGNLDDEDREQFSPAPSISWTLHYHPPPNIDPAKRPNKFWATVDLGAGLNVAALDWDNGIQLGVGGHLSFFKDLLIVGGGYNLHESARGGYVFLGLGLFQALNQLGGLTGANNMFAR